MSLKGQIIALGGGGFSMEPDNPLLDRYVLAQARTPEPRICFVSTASGDSESYIQRFRDFFAKLPCKPAVLSLFWDPPHDLESFIMEQDVICVGGGNTRNMLLIWRDRGLDLVLRKAVEAGVVITGISAGSICWFRQGVTDSNKPADSDELSVMDCLDFLPGSNCPHYDGESNRRPEYHRLLAAGQIVDGIAADDGVALHYRDGRLHAVVSSRPGASAYRVRLTDGTVSEDKLPTRLLDRPA